MGPFADDNYRTALLPALDRFGGPFQSNEEAYVDELLRGKDEINKTDIMSRMDQFSCREELERYVEKAEEYRFHVIS